MDWPFYWCYVQFESLKQRININIVKRMVVFEIMAYISFIKHKFRLYKILIHLF